METSFNQEAVSSTAPSHCKHKRQHHRGGHRFGKAVFIVLLAVAAGVTGGFISKAVAQEHPMMKPEERGVKMDERITRMVKHMAVEVDATPEQTQKLIAIAKAVAKDLAPVREKLQAARQRGIALMAAPQIDRQALEQLRVEQISMMDSNSKRLMQAMADSAEVLTPAQRQKFAEQFKKMGGPMGGPMGGRFGHHGGMGGQ